MTKSEYSKRLGFISKDQFQSALDHFDLGRFISAEAIPFGLFGQNVFVTSTTGEYVLRGTAHYDWQFPKEQFIANLLYERSDVPVPWPYLLNTDETVFGWKYGYVLMPRMPGLQMADPEVLKTLSTQDREAIAYAMGENLRRIQQVQWPFAGQYDLNTKSIEPFREGFEAWLINELRQIVQRSVSHHTGFTESDEAWVEGIIQNAAASLRVPYTPVLVMHDYKESNLTVSKQEDDWKVSGVFDLMEALIGDGELDLVRQLATYVEAKVLHCAKTFLDGYQKHESVRPYAEKRLALYMVYDRMVVWEYFHRPNNISQWPYEKQSFQEWISPYISSLEMLL
jgi:hygromycin-B 7''-O-kinase